MNDSNDAVEAIFSRVRVSRQDETVFLIKLSVALLLTIFGGVLTLTQGWLGTSLGVVLLALMYTHMVELQHQCLHHSAFRRSGAHRPIGFLLGLPSLSAYSHYRVQHLQHHKFLGTPQDSEFFGFDTRAPLTWSALLRGMFLPTRLLQVSVDIIKAVRGTWNYTMGTIGARSRQHVVAEYRIFALWVLAAVTLSVLGYGHIVLLLWVAPLLISIPIHFLLELPEHVLCDNDSTDVMRNTRTISGSWLSQWFTNGNNFHVEHHAAMVVPINRLAERHSMTKRHARHVEETYLSFYLKVIREARRNGKRHRLPRELALKATDRERRPD